MTKRRFEWGVDAPHIEGQLSLEDVEEADGSIQGVCEPAEPVRPLSAAEVAQLKTNQKEL